MVLCKQRNGDAVPFPFLGGGIFSAPQHLRFTEWLMMCGEGNKLQEQMTSEAAKNLVSIANALSRMEKGGGWGKGQKVQGRKMTRKDVFSAFLLFPHQLQLVLKGVVVPQTYI